MKQPCVKEKSSSGTRLIDLDTEFFSNRELFLDDEIHPASVMCLVKQLKHLVEQDAGQPITIYINSPGGSVTDGLIIYDCIKALPCELNLICTGMAASMAAIILAGGQKGHRYILPHSKVMIHEPLLTGGVGGSATSINRRAESIMQTRRLIAELLAADTGRSVEEIEKAISFDNYMNPQEAIEFGLVDEIVRSIF